MLGDKLMKLRKKQGYSQQQVADILEVTRQTISNWESDQGAPSLDRAKELAELYRIGLDDLVSDDVGVMTAAEENTLSSDLHVLQGIVGKTCQLDCANTDWLMMQGFEKRVRVLEVNTDWVRVEYERSKDNVNFLKKESVIQLIELSIINGFMIREADND